MSPIVCPKCQGALEPVVYAEIEVDRCVGCQGIWFDSLEAQTLKQVQGSESIDIGDPNVGSVYNLQTTDIDCPRCQTKLTKMVDLDQPHIWYEKCPTCYGLWFDAGEFKDFKETSLADFVRGMFAKERR